MKKLFLVMFIFGFTLACKNRKPGETVSDMYYTCSMHPQVMETKPGTCPICHMELIPVKKTSLARGEISLNEEQIRLGNIQTDTIRSGKSGDQIVLTATLATDETALVSVNARIGGRIERLYVKSPGDYVAKGSRLYDLYSEELNNTKQEYLAALERKQTMDNSIIDFDRLIRAARSRLQLWGMTESRIAELEKTKTASTITPFYSPAAGVITELPVLEGQYVAEGNMVIRIADLQSLWAEAQVYASQWNHIDLKGNARVQFPDLPGKTFSGKIEFANPEINSPMRINLIRIRVPNPGNILKPGMPAYVLLSSRRHDRLQLPAEAVLRNGKMASVWVKSGEHTYQSRMVETGLEGDQWIEIKSGLQAGDVVVVSGAYLLQSEYIFKIGADPMAGHKHME